LSQTVPFPGKRSLDARVADHEVVAVEWDTARRETDLVRQVTIAFARAVVAERKVAQLDTVTSLAETMAAATARRVESGAAPDQEQLRAELEHDRARLDLESARRDAGVARQALARLLGMAGDPLPPLGDGVREQIDLAALDRTPGTVVAGHPEFSAAVARRDRATQVDRRARLDPLPDFTIGVAGGRNAANDEDLVELSVSFPLPIFDRGQARRQETGARIRAAEADVAAVDQRLREQLLSVRARVLTAHRQVAAYRERMLPRAEEALRLVRAGFEAGKLGFADLIDTQRTAAEVRLDYLDRLLDLNIALADWETLVGNAEAFTE
jgi:cobalt-zinc-cadmium efflux system outer membrane protein